MLENIKILNSGESQQNILEYLTNRSIGFKTEKIRTPNSEEIRPSLELTFLKKIQIDWNLLNKNNTNIYDLGKNTYFLVLHHDGEGGFYLSDVNFFGKFSGLKKYRKRLLELFYQNKQIYKLDDISVFLRQALESLDKQKTNSSKQNPLLIISCCYPDRLKNSKLPDGVLVWGENSQISPEYSEYQTLIKENMLFVSPSIQD